MTKTHPTDSDGGGISIQKQGRAQRAQRLQARDLWHYVDHPNATNIVRVLCS
jgi:hypothetical protein